MIAKNHCLFTLIYARFGLNKRKRLVMTTAACRFECIHMRNNRNTRILNSDFLDFAPKPNNKYEIIDIVAEWNANNLHIVRHSIKFCGIFHTLWLIPTPWLLLVFFSFALCQSHSSNTNGDYESAGIHRHTHTRTQKVHGTYVNERYNVFYYR